MGAVKYTAIRAMFEALWASQLPRLIRRLSRCRGVIFTLHHVLPEEPADFSPNAILQVKPEFLDFTIRRVRELGLDIVDLGEALRRIESDEQERRFCVFTFDDAYRDNLRYALPILRRNQCPFTLYVPTALVDDVGESGADLLSAGHLACSFAWLVWWWFPGGESAYMLRKTWVVSRQVDNLGGVREPGAEGDEQRGVAALRLTRLEHRGGRRQGSPWCPVRNGLSRPDFRTWHA